MGNCCCPTPVDNHSPRTTKHSSPAQSTINAEKKSSISSSSSSSRSRSSNSAEKGGGSRVEGKTVIQNMGPSTTGGEREIMMVTRRNLKMFSFTELKSATRNFRPDTMLGEGGFGRVFKGWVDEKTYAPSKAGFGIPVAVKISNPDSEQGLKEWQAEVKFLGKFSHPNLVKLLGYCWEDRQFLLVYEYMQKGSLESHLFRNGAEPLIWETRLKIAVGAGRGLAFLHTTEKSVIYRDFKPSNILLDMDLNAKLSDFGLAKLGPSNGDSHVTTRVMGTYGYAAPEYLASGHLYLNSDIYGFGVVLLEILTGRRVLDLNRPTGEHNLVEWGRPFLSEKRKLKKIMDPNLEDRYSANGAFQAAQLILKCLEPDPKNRPSSEEVLGTLEEIAAIKMKFNEANPTPRRAAQHRESPGHNRRHHHHLPTPLDTNNHGGTRARSQPRSPMA